MQIYVDESKAKAYLIVAVIVSPGQAAGFRKRMIGLRMPRQGHIHFVNERDSRRKMILDELVDMAIRARVYSISGLNPIAARPQLLGALMDDLQALGATTLTLELEETALKSDELVLRNGLLKRSLKHQVEYAHRTKSEEPLLWIADAIAWSYARGGDYRRRAQPLIESVSELTV